MHEKKNEDCGKVSRSFNLDQENVLWLETVNEKLDRKSVSNTLNYILTLVRMGKAVQL